MGNSNSSQYDVRSLVPSCCPVPSRYLTIANALARPTGPRTTRVSQPAQVQHARPTQQQSARPIRPAAEYGVQGAGSEWRAPATRVRPAAIWRKQGSKWWKRRFVLVLWLMWNFSSAGKEIASRGFIAGCFS